MIFRGLIVACLATVAWAAFGYYEGECPPENSAVAYFRNLTDVRRPLTLPLIDRVLKDVQYADPEIVEKLDEVDLPWKVALPLNETNLQVVAIPFRDRCCENPQHVCESQLIVLQYLKYLGGVCWVVWPEQYFQYTRCTCCTCLLAEDCPVVGRCVETNYLTVGIIAYCPHIMYADRFRKIALRIPTACRCQASCPARADFVLPFDSPEQEKTEQRLSIANFQRLTGGASSVPV